jgi:signal peptidase
MVLYGYYKYQAAIFMNRIYKIEFIFFNYSEIKEAIMKRVKAKKSASKYMKIISASLITIISVFILTIITQGIVIRINKDYVPSIFGYTYLNVLSDSMKPVYQTMDVIVGQKINSIDKLKVSDIITYRDGSQLVSHRVKAISEVDGQKVIIARGDANNTDDRTEVTSKNIVSKYSFKIPFAGYILSKIYDFKFLLFIWAIAMYFIVKNFILEIKKNKKSKLSEEDPPNIPKEMEA